MICLFLATLGQDFDCSLVVEYWKIVKRLLCLPQSHTMLASDALSSL